MHFILFGMILGWGAAIPIGPVNLEIIRRNLTYGTRFGLALGLGACMADLTYLILLCVGIVTFLQNPMTLAIIGILGAFILFWFGFKAITAIPNNTIITATIPSTLLRNILAGYFITLLNPYTILFWASVSSQLTLTTSRAPHGILFAGIGLMISTISWIIFLNILLHLTRQKISNTLSHRLNQLGGIILLGFLFTALFTVLG